MKLSLLPLIISVISLLISLIQFTISIYSKRFTIDISPIGFQKSESELYERFFFKLLIENKSNLPISITNIKVLKSDNSLFNCSLTKHFVGESFMTFNGQEVNKNVYYTTDFPINILPYGAVMPCIVFRIPKNNDINIFKNSMNNIELEIHTNRKVKRVCLTDLKEINFLD
ncbi:MAG: hypothetical protein E6940_10625 [Clostridium septicum]|uniref:hypothetical protein n=1 Tax=Clostridium septicum TaxID=1504 RepID=UPI00258356D3|nr:hypothetical protein [Clostridium septicum]MDU1314498.1 hypothetical protein [Clostridium septicum]